MLAEAHMEAWAAAFLASDPHSGSRTPASVSTPSGPMADIQALWSGHALFDAASIVAPTLLVRGAWDSLCTDDDAARLLASIAAANKSDVKIDCATHLMHLEQQRGVLYERINAFLLQSLR